MQGCKHLNHSPDTESYPNSGQGGADVQGGFRPEHHARGVQQPHICPRNFRAQEAVSLGDVSARDPAGDVAHRVRPAECGGLSAEDAELSEAVKKVGACLLSQIRGNPGDSAAPSVPSVMICASAGNG